MSPYRDVSAEQRIADLELELSKLQDELEEAQKLNRAFARSRVAPLLEAVCSPFVWVISLLLVGVSAGIWQTARADGKIDYCYVDSFGEKSDKRALYGHRPWRSDAQLRSMPVAEDPAPLFALAKELGCPIR